MPLYEYQCACGRKEERFVAFENRRNSIRCSCGEWMRYLFPLGATFQPFEAYYDEALNCDIKGRRHKKEVMRILGVQEAGDAVHGARNFDQHAPYHVKPLPLQGIEPVSPELKLIETEKAFAEEWQVEAQKGETWTPLAL